MPCAMTARSVRARRSRVLWVPTRVRGIDDGTSTRLLGWLSINEGAQIKVDLSTIDTVNVPFHWVVLMVPLVFIVLLWWSAGKRLVMARMGALGPTWRG